MKACRLALLIAALSPFASAPSSADVLWVFDGVCTQSTFLVGASYRTIDCATLADPTVHAELVLHDDDTFPFTFSYSDHAQGHSNFVCVEFPDRLDCHEEIIGGDSFSYSRTPHRFGDCDGGPCGVFGSFDSDLHVALPEVFFDSFGADFFGFLSRSHQVSGIGAWRVSEPPAFALFALGLAGLAAARRRKRTK